MGGERCFISKVIKKHLLTGAERRHDAGCFFVRKIFLMGRILLAVKGWSDTLLITELSQPVFIKQTGRKMMAFLAFAQNFR